VFSFSLQLPHKTFNIPRRIQRGVFISRLRYSVCHSYPTLTKLEFSQKISMPRLKIKFYSNSYNGSRVVPCEKQTEGRTERQTDMTRLTAALHNYANTPKTADFLKIFVHQPTQLLLDTSASKFLLYTASIGRNREVNNYDSYPI